MPLLHDASDESRSANISQLMHEGRPQEQAVAIALSIQRAAKGKKEVGKADVAMTQKEYLEEHTRLIAALKSPSHKDDMEEAGRQEEEVEEHTGHEVGKAEHEYSPTEGQKRAGNYAKTHWRIHGLDVTIENLAGSQRSGMDPDGKPWSVTMPYHYGYVRGTEGADGDHLDVAVGPLMGSGTEAHIINQKNPKTGDFDEHKVFIGFQSRDAAIAAFRMGRNDNPEDAMGNVITVPIDELRRWLDEGNLHEEAVLKAETTHVKAHYRVVDGRVVYVPAYDRATHGDHRPAELHERSVQGVNRNGDHYIRATDAEDRDTILEVARREGVAPREYRASGATHHGRAGAYPHIYFHNEADAAKVQRALQARQGNDAPTHPAPAASRPPAQQDRAQVITPAQVRAHEEPSEDRREADAAARGDYFTRHRAGVLDRRVYLKNTNEGHNKFYVIDLRQIGDGKWVVNTGNGRIDRPAITIRTKTERPVSQAEADSIVAELKRNKMDGGYRSIEDSSTPSPRASFTAMDNWPHPTITEAQQREIDAQLSRQMTQPIAGRGTAPAAPARGVSVPTAVPPEATAGAPAAAPAAPRVTPAQYEAARQIAYNLGNAARGSEGNRTSAAFLASFRAYKAHVEAEAKARAVGAAEGSSSGARWHADRAQHWLNMAKAQWTSAATPILMNNGIHDAGNTGQGFTQALANMQDARTVLENRPPGAPLPSGTTQEILQRTLADLPNTIKSLEFGKEIEDIAPNSPSRSPNAYGDAVLTAITLALHGEKISPEHKEAATKIRDSINNLRNAMLATESTMQQKTAEAPTIRALAETVRSMATKAKEAMSQAPAKMLWRNAPRRAVEAMERTAVKADETARIRANRPSESDPRHADAQGENERKATELHQQAIATGASRETKIKALEAHKRAAVSTYHAALALPAGSPERATMMQKAQDFAEKARAMVSHINGAR